MSRLTDKFSTRLLISSSHKLILKSSNHLNSNIDRTERFYYLGFSLGKFIDLGNAVNTVKILLMIIVDLCLAVIV